MLTNRHNKTAVNCCYIVEYRSHILQSFRKEYWYLRFVCKILKYTECLPLTYFAFNLVNISFIWNYYPKRNYLHIFHERSYKGIVYLAKQICTTSYCYKTTADMPQQIWIYTHYHSVSTTELSEILSGDSAAISHPLTVSRAGICRRTASKS